MKYERLTDTKGIGIGLKDSNEVNIPNYINILARLAFLEDKIENGTLVELPCKKGDYVYEVCEKFIFEIKIDTLDFENNRISVNGGESMTLDELKQNNVFFTLEEAKAKLKELRGE